MKWYWWALIVIVVLGLLWYFFIYKKGKSLTGSTGVKTLDDATKRKFQNECEMIWNTQAEVDKCASEKAVAAGFAA